jgi:hypothetical protein
MLNVAMLSLVYIKMPNDIDMLSAIVLGVVKLKVAAPLF